MFICRLLLRERTDSYQVANETCDQVTVRVCPKLLVSADSLAARGVLIAGRGLCHTSPSRSCDAHRVSQLKVWTPLSCVVVTQSQDLFHPGVINCGTLCVYILAGATPMSRIAPWAEQGRINLDTYRAAAHCHGHVAQAVEVVRGHFRNLVLINTRWALYVRGTPSASLPAEI